MAKFTFRGFTIDWAWRVAVNTPVPGWRGWLGNQLRCLAQRIDGCHSLGVRIETTPAIGMRSELAIINCGIDTMYRGAQDLVREAAVDQALREVFPELVSGP